MNRRLQQVVAAARNQDPDRFNRLPECIEEFLDYGPALSCAFNRPGTLLATGTDNGYVGIWDFETRGLAKALPPDEEPEPSEVTSLCWSRNGRYLLSGHAKPAKAKSEGRGADKPKAQDRIVLWDVQAGTQLRNVVMPSGVTRVCLSARKPFVAVVSLKAGPPVLVDLNKESTPVTPLDGIDLKAVLDGAGSTKQRGHGEPGAPVALLSKSCREVYVAVQQSGKGFLLLYDLGGKQPGLLDLIKLPSPVSSMALNKQGSSLLLNCLDKVIRLADVAARPAKMKPVSRDAAEEALRSATADKQGSLLHPDGRALISLLPVTYSTPVDRELWVAAVFTHDGKHVLGASASSKHRIHIWSNSGEPVAVLEGPKNDEVLALSWHPNRMLMVTVSSTGRVYIWAQIYNEEWSAFAPDFQELEENTEYEEKEDEFDINPKLTDAAAAAAGDKAAAADDPHSADVIDERLPAGRKAAAAYQHLLDSDGEGGGGASDSEEPLLWLVGEVDVPGPDAAADRDGPEQAAGSGSEQDASDEEEAGLGASGRTGAAADSDGGGTDQPKERKRKAVRFEQFDDQAFEELMRMQEEHARQAQTAPKGTGRRGRPPKNRTPEGQPQQQPGVRGAGGAIMRGTYVFGKSGSLLNPSDSD